MNGADTEMNEETEQEQERETRSKGLALGDIYFVLFRQKWKIIAFAFVGALGAVGLFTVKPPLWRSEARLFIRYIEDARTPGVSGTETPVISLSQQYDSIIATEVEILKSLDLARQVVDDIGIERVLSRPAGITNRDEAAAQVMRNILIESAPKGGVIPITFQHPNPEVTQDILRKIIIVYSKRHLAMRNPVAINSDFFVQETERLKNELSQIDQALKDARTKAGVSSNLEETRKAHAEEISKIRQELFTAEAELVEHQVTLNGLPRMANVTAANTNGAAEIPAEQIKQYQRQCALLTMYMQKEAEYLITYTEESRPVKDLRAKIKSEEEKRAKLEAEFPGLTNLAVALAKAGQVPLNTIDPATESARVLALKSKVEVYNSQLAQIQALAAKVDEFEPTIINLQRRKEFTETELKNTLNLVNQSRVEGALGAGMAANISVVQSPSPPDKKWTKMFKKRLAIVTLGPFFFGIALAFFIELFLDRSVKRPKEIETQLGLPLFLSIPNLNGNGKPRRLGDSMPRRLLLGNGSPNTPRTPSDAAHVSADTEVVSWDAQNEMRPFYEALRDRLVTFFESRHLTRNPKLVAVTSCDEGCGVTTIAAGLAATLSEIGEGNVLLVDMKRKQESAHLFFKGNIECGLDSALQNETRTEAQVQENLYVVTEATDTDKLTRALPKRFAHLMPKLKSSDYEYVIFDMPPVSQISVTPKLARFMDINLLVVEAEKTDRDVVKKASSMLGSTLGNLGVVLNKKQVHVPEWLLQEL